MNSEAQLALRRSRQKTILITLATVLTIAGFAVLFFLKRIPLPLRIAIGFGDLVAASALMLFLRQNFGKNGPKK